MIVLGRCVFGSLNVFFGRLHYRFEIRPYAEKHGYTREQIYRASLREHEQAFNEAWPIQEGQP